MIKEKYSYLKKYVGQNDLKGTFFLPVEESDIVEAESLLGCKFPDQLREFYAEIGDGILSCGEKYPEMHCLSCSNLILPPVTTANFARGILEFENQDYYMAQSTYELLEPGDLPFFEIGDSTRFLLMKLNSDNPNAVWCYDIKIEDSFEKFIWRLYYENPTFYDDIIEAHYKNK